MYRVCQSPHQVFAHVIKFRVPVVGLKHSKEIKVVVMAKINQPQRQIHPFTFVKHH